MRFGYDPRKNTWNIRERGLPFDGVAMLDWEGAIIRRDTGRDYGEDGYQAPADGFAGKPYVVVFTMRENTIGIISCRRAHAKERQTYGKTA
jgi:uncharacterized DUF497 family protein